MEGENLRQHPLAEVVAPLSATVVENSIQLDMLDTDVDVYRYMDNIVQ